MDFKEFFAKVVKVLDKEGVRYALAGGLVASVYRLDQRLTADLDFLFFVQPPVQEKAAQIIRSLGLKPHAIRKADLQGGPHFAIKRKSTPVWMIAGRGDGDPSKIGLDFILPGMPWFESALARTLSNKIDFGFGALPCLTVEDVIVSKLFSLKNDQSRFNDLDDLKSIFLARRPLDLAYLSGQMQKLDLPVPKPIKEIVPKVLNLISLPASRASRRIS